MSTYCVTFRIVNKTIGGQTYNDRYNRLISNVYGPNGFWDGTTSFLLANSSQDTVGFAERATDGLSQEDMVFLFDPDDMSACYFGAVPELEILRSFFPKLERIG